MYIFYFGLGVGREGKGEGRIQTLFIVVLAMQREWIHTIFCISELVGDALVEETVSKGDGTVH